MQITISKEELALLPAAEFSGEYCIVDSPEAVQEAVDYLRNVPIIGFDTETRPSFRRGVSHNVSLLQLASADKCFLFRLHVLGLPEPVRELLEDKKCLKVGVSLKDDFLQLGKIGLNNPDGFIELQKFVKDFNISDNSLSRIYAILFGHRIAKAQRLSNWEAPTLSPAQINYAAFDAVACIHIYTHLIKGLFNPEKSKYLQA